MTCRPSNGAFVWPWKNYLSSLAQVSSSVHGRKILSSHVKMLERLREYLAVGVGFMVRVSRPWLWSKHVRKQTAFLKALPHRVLTTGNLHPLTDLPGATEGQLWSWSLPCRSLLPSNSVSLSFGREFLNVLSQTNALELLADLHVEQVCRLLNPTQIHWSGHLGKEPGNLHF